MVVSPGPYARLPSDDAARGAGSSDLQALTNHLPGIVWCAAADGRSSYVSDPYFRLTGLARDTADVDDFGAVIHPEDRSRVLAAWAESLRTGAPYEAEFRLRTAGGDYRWFLSRAEAVRDAAGAVVQWYGLSTDITGRKGSELRTGFLDRFNHLLARATQPEVLLDDALALASAQWDVDLAVFGEVLESDSDVLRVVHEHRRSGSSAIGEHPWSRFFVPEALEALRDGRPVAIDDTREHPWTRADYLEGYAIRAFVAVPLRADGRLCGALSLNSRQARRWRPDEVALLEEASGRLFAYVGRLRAQQALVRSELVFRRFAESNLIGVGFGTLRGGVSYVNDEMLRMMGRTREDFDARRIDWYQAIAPEFHERMAQELLLLAQQGRRTGHECAFLRPDGGRTPYLAGAALVDNDGDFHVSVALDLTRLRAAEDEARSSAGQLRFALDSANAGAWSWDFGTGALTWSDSMYRLSGFAPADGPPSFESWSARVHPDDVAHLVNLKARATRGETGRLSARFRLYPSPGTERWILTQGRVERDADGRLLRFSGLDIDITDRERAALAERDASRLLRAVLDSTTDSVWVKDPAGRLTLGNQALIDALGDGDPARVLGRTIQELAADPDQARHIAGNDARVLADNATIVVEETFGKEDRMRIYQSVKSPLRDDDGRVAGIVGISRDVTDLRRSEQERALSQRRLEESFALLDAVFDSAPVGLAFLDREFRYVRINRELAELNGQPVEAHLGRRVAEVLPDIWPAVQPLLQQVRDTGEALTGVDIRAPVPGRHAPTEDTWWSAAYFPLRVRGEVFGLGIVAQDVTAQKNAEQVLQVADQRKDRFLATLAHELRNPLAPIRNAFAILRRRLTEPESAVLVAMVERQLAHLVRLVDDLLEVGRITRDKLELRTEQIDLRGIVSSALEIANPLIREKGHRLAVDVGSGPVEVRGDRVRLVQVTANLLNNAARYTPAGGEITLTVARDGDEAVIAVQDNGIGIGTADLRNIFQVFAQAEVVDAASGGTGGLGIGLWLVRRLVTLHGGSVDAASDGRGKGSRFVVRLPAVPTSAADPVEA